MGEGWGEGDNLHPSRHPKLVERRGYPGAPTSARPEPVEGHGYPGAPTSARPEPVEGRQSLRRAPTPARHCEDLPLILSLSKDHPELVEGRGNLVAVAMAVRRRVLNRKPELPKRSWQTATTLSTSASLLGAKPTANPQMLRTTSTSRAPVHRPYQSQLTGSVCATSSARHPRRK